MIIALLLLFALCLMLAAALLSVIEEAKETRALASALRARVDALEQATPQVLRNA